MSCTRIVPAGACRAPRRTSSDRAAAGAIELAETVVAAAAQPETPLQPLYPLDWATERKIERIARIMYGADGISILPAAAAKLRKAARLGHGELLICMAKTQDSLSDNPKLRGRPRGFTLTVRDVEIAAGAGFLVALTGDIVRMPGLPGARRRTDRRRRRRADRRAGLSDTPRERDRAGGHSTGPFRRAGMRTAALPIPDVLRRITSDERRSRRPQRSTHEGRTDNI